MSFTARQVEQAFEDGGFKGEYGSWSSRKGEVYTIHSGNGWGEVDGVVKVYIDGVVYAADAVEVVGGGEGSGEHTHVVFKIEAPEGTRFFKKDGYYASHYGTDWDGDFSEVEPFEKTVTDYRKI